MYKVHKQMHNISMVLKCHGWVQFFFFFWNVQKDSLGRGGSNFKKRKVEKFWFRYLLSPPLYCEL